MPKNLLIIILTVIMIMSVSACGGEKTAEETSEAPGMIIPETEPSATPETTVSDDNSSPEVDEKEESEIAEPAVPDFVDLTEMSSTMVYSYVYDMLIRPTEYLGKTVKVHGTYNQIYFEANDTTYNYVVVNDATGCCPQGIEFIVPEGVEFPAQDTPIELVGVFESYDRGDFKYTRLVVEEIVLR